MRNVAVDVVCAAEAAASNVAVRISQTMRTVSLCLGAALRKRKRGIRL